MPRIVSTAPAGSGPRVRRRSKHGEWTPYEDWTGHHYKPASECVFDPHGIILGRDRMTGKRGVRTMPVLPGGARAKWTPELA